MGGDPFGGRLSRISQSPATRGGRGDRRRRGDSGAGQVLMATPLSSMVLVSFGAFIGSFGAAFLKAGATRLHFSLPSLVRNWRLALGVFFFCFSSILFVLGLRHGELSVL